MDLLLAWSTDIPSAYLEVLTKEHVCVIADPEFGLLEGHLLIIVCGLMTYIPAEPDGMKDLLTS